MNEAGKNLEGQVVDGKFPLLRCLGESGQSVVFLTERKTEPQKAAIKLVPATAEDAPTQISRWQAAAKLSHPNLIRVFEIGRCQIGNESYAYVVMEYAEENLYQILPDRPLSAEEARQMLPSMLDALGYVHQQGFVHGHVKPSNILAVGDQVKLSSEGAIRIGEPARTPAAGSLYDPPEAATAPVSPARDVWALGVTLVEALTQHPPTWADTPDGKNVLPQSLPAPFSDIVRNCLRARPEERWSLDEIAASLAPSTSPKPAPRETAKQFRPEPVLADANKKPTFAKPGILLATNVIAVALLAFFFVKLMHRAPAQESHTVSSAAASQETAPSAPAPAPAANPPSAPVVSQNAPSTAAAPAPAAPAPATSVPETAPESATPDTVGAIVQKVLPEVPRSASKTIHGTIRVRIRAKVDSSGKVSSASLVSPGSSAYFAKLALQSAQKWSFAPAKRDGEENPSTWILQFEFRKNGVRAAAERAN